MIRNKKVICFGEVLWDNLPTGRQIGGAPLNVCYHLLKAGIDNRIISQVGEDENGQELLAGAQRLGIDLRYCKTTPDHPTSTVEVQLLGDNKVAYEIVDQVAWDYIAVDEKAVEAIKTADAFVYGSLVARNQPSRQTLLHYLQYAGWPVFDVNLRAPFYSKERITQLLEYCRTLKVNDEEIEMIAGWFGLEGSEGTVTAHLFKDFSKLEEIIITKGAEGVSYYSRETERHLPAIPVNVADTVGSGDSFLAAFIANRLWGASIDTCLSKAVALSAFVATRKGGTPGYELSDIDW